MELSNIYEILNIVSMFLLLFWLVAAATSVALVLEFSKAKERKVAMVVTLVLGGILILTNIAKLFIGIPIRRGFSVGSLIIVFVAFVTSIIVYVVVDSRSEYIEEERSQNQK